MSFYTNHPRFRAVMIDDKSDDERNRYKFPTQAKNATYGYINLPCDSRVRLLGVASIPGLQKLLGMTARPIVSVDWAGPQFQTVDAKGFTAWRFLEEIFRHGLEDAFVLCLRDLPSRLLPNHRGLSSVPAAVHYLRSLVPGDAFHFVRRKSCVRRKNTRRLAGDIHKLLRVR